jgi:hypothetical protein
MLDVSRNRLCNDYRGPVIPPRDPYRAVPFTRLSTLGSAEMETGFTR